MGSKGSQTTTTQNAPDPNAYAQYLSLLGRAGNVASTPYQAYGGELVAPFNQQQNMGVAGINSNAGYASPYVQSGIGQAASSSAPLTAAGIQQYMSPYTQNVVNATQNQFNNQNQQQMQAVTGNAIAQGALGGNRTAVAQAELANQQQLAQAPVIAGLYNSGYGQAVNTAMGEQGIGLQGASTMGNLGIAGQSAALQGAGAQLAAGTQQQQTQQALDTALMQQFQQQQAYPYQQTQWLAGIDTGVGSQMGGTGSTTAPAPNMLNSILGGVSSGVGALGATGAFGSTGWLAPLMLSDRRVKENIRHIGATHNGQKLYMFNFKGDPQKHIGLIAQEVEKTKPEAIHENAQGIKHVDYEKALERAAGGVVGVRGYDSGGGVMPYSGAPSWIPNDPITHGRGAPNPPSTQGQGQNLNQQAQGLSSIANTLLGKNSSPGNPLSLAPSNPGDSSASPIGPVDPAIAGANSITSGIYARGGSVRGFADGGSPSFEDMWTDTAGQLPSMATDTGVAPPSNPDGVINPDEPLRMPDQQAVEDWRHGVDHPNPALQSDVDYKGPSDESIQGVSADRALAYNSGDRHATDTSSLPPEVSLGYSDSNQSPTQGIAPSSSSHSIDWGSSNKLWPALMSAGFGMMASRSPFLGVAIGEGGQAGVASYNQQQAQDIKQQQLEMERQKMMLPYNNMTADQKAMLQLKQAEMQRPFQIGQDFLGRPIYAVRGANGSLSKIDPATGNLTPLNGGTPSGAAPTNWGRIPNVPQPQTAPASGGNANAAVSGGSPATPQAGVTQAAYVTDDPTLPSYMRTSDEESNRDNSVLDRAAQEDPRAPGIIKGVANYEINPATLPMKSRQGVLAWAKMYDPNYDQTLYNAKQRSMTEFFAGGNSSPAGTILNGNTAILHLGEMFPLVDQMEKDAGSSGLFSKGSTAIANSGLPYLSYYAREMRNSGMEGTGTPLANSLSAWNDLKTRFTDEVTKFYASGGGSEGERERALAAIDQAKSPAEMKAAIRADIKAMRDKVEMYQGRMIAGLNPGAWKQIAQKDPSLVTTYKKARDVSDSIMGGQPAIPGGAPAETSPSQSSTPQHPANAVGTRKDTQGRNWYVDKDGKPIGPAQ